MGAIAATRLVRVARCDGRGRQTLRDGECASLNSPVVAIANTAECYKLGFTQPYWSALRSQHPSVTRVSFLSVESSRPWRSLTGRRRRRAREVDESPGLEFGVIRISRESTKGGHRKRGTRRGAVVSGQGSKDVGCAPLKCREGEQRQRQQVGVAAAPRTWLL